MNAPINSPRPLPSYGIRDDEKTRPCVVLYDWNGDDEATVQVNSVEPGDIEDAEVVAALPGAEDEFDADLFRPRWHGIGRRPGAVALAVVLGLCMVIGVFALLEPGEAQAVPADAAAVVSLR